MYLKVKRQTAEKKEHPKVYSQLHGLKWNSFIWNYFFLPPTSLVYRYGQVEEKREWIRAWIKRQNKYELSESFVSCYGRES